MGDLKQRYFRVLDSDDDAGGYDDDTPQTESMFGNARVCDLLRARRQELGLSLRDAADNLKIRYVYMEAIENGAYTELPGTAYAIGFVRTYAEYLGLNGDAIVRHFKEEMAGKVGQQHLYFPTPVPEARIPGGTILLFAVVLTGIVYGGWYYLSATDRNVVDLVPPLPQRLMSLLDMDPVSPTGPLANPTTEPPTHPPAKPSPTVTTPVPPVPGRASAPPQTGSTAADGQTPAVLGTEAEPVDETDSEPQSPANGRALAAIAAVSTSSAPGSDEPVPIDPVSPTASAQSVVSPRDQVSPIGLGPASAEAAQEPIQAEDLTARSVANLTRDNTSGATGPTTTADAAGTLPDPLSLRGPVVRMDDLTIALRPKPSPPAALFPAEPDAADRSLLPPGSTIADPIAANEGPTTPPLPPDSAGIAGGRVFGYQSEASRVVLRATADSWVQVRDANGDLLFTRVLQPGDVYQVPNRPGVVLRTGNAGGLAVTVDGADLPPLGGNGQVLRRVTLDPAALRQSAQSVN